MKRVRLAIMAAVTAVSAFATSQAMADLRNFTLVNNTAWPMYLVYISEPDSPDWGREVLGRDQTLQPSRLTHISFTGGGGCVQDVRIVFSREVDLRWNRVNLCTVSRMSVWYDFGSRSYQANWN
jgi:hypothetical protein